MAIEENPFDHVLYEFSMYLQAYLTEGNDQFTTNLLVDSRLVHLRNLACFFDSKNNDRGIHARNYVNHPEYCLIEHKQLDDIIQKTSCAACHISYKRASSDFKQKTAECEAHAFTILVPLIKNYLDLLDADLKPEYLSFWKDERIQAEALYVRELIETRIENGNGLISI